MFLANPFQSYVLTHGSVFKVLFRPRFVKSGILTSFTSILHGLIYVGEITYVRDASATADLLKRDDIDALEIHTSGR